MEKKKCPRISRGKIKMRLSHFLQVLQRFDRNIFLEKDKHCYLKKNAEKILFFTCSEKVKTQGQVNLFFTKIKLVKNEKELEALRYYHAMFFQ